MRDSGNGEGFDVLGNDEVAAREQGARPCQLYEVEFGAGLAPTSTCG